jgi:small-conductance mechanosensitive channel
MRGAEIVIPNGKLISTELINWTLKDDRRRMEIPLGVAYGSDPETVLDLLEMVAGEHEEVSKNPKPQALFLDFGESSLDFMLRAWTSANQYMRVGSELRVAIRRAIDKAGIEIPFPQRDLHLRSIDDQVSFKAGREAQDVE